MMLDILLNRRSVRSFKKDKLEKEKIEKLVKAALLSPSSRNLNPWEFIFVDDTNLLNRLSNSKAHGSAFLKGAPLGIVVIADPEKCDVWVEDTSIASIIIQLMAETMNLGTCWIQIRKRMHNSSVTAEDYIKEVLNIPKEYKVESIIAVGYPNHDKIPHNEDELMYEKVFSNKYGEKNIMC